MALIDAIVAIEYIKQVAILSASAVAGSFQGDNIISAATGLEIGTIGRPRKRRVETQGEEENWDFLICPCSPTNETEPEGMYDLYRSIPLSGSSSCDSFNFPSIETFPLYIELTKPH